MQSKRLTGEKKMNVRPCAIFATLFLLPTFGFQMDANGADEIRFIRQEQTLFLSCAGAAAVLDVEFKIVHPQRLVTFCQGGEGGLCIPVRLTPDNHRQVGKDLMVAADVLERALRCRVGDKGETVTITRLSLAEIGSLKNESPAYNAAWGTGRGFRKGETLPDIPLVDLQGNEVRFSQFLGKRYILYCWASW